MRCFRVCKWELGKIRERVASEVRPETVRSRGQSVLGGGNSFRDGDFKEEEPTRVGETGIFRHLLKRRGNTDSYGSSDSPNRTRE